MTQAPKPKSKPRAKQERATVPPLDAVSTATPRKRGRKPKVDEAEVAAPSAC